MGSTVLCHQTKPNPSPAYEELQHKKAKKSGAIESPEIEATEPIE